MTAVDKATLSSVPHKATYDILNSPQYIRDPRRKDGTRNRKFVYTTDPVLESFDFSLFPYIVFTPEPRIQTLTGADRTTSEIQWTQKLVVHTLKTGSGANKEDVGVDDMNYIMDQIQLWFNSKEIFQEYARLGINFRNIVTTSEMESIVLDQAVILESTFLISLRTRLKIQ